MPRQAFRWTNPPENFRASGPEVLRAYFFPRQVLQIQEAARIIGISREALYKRLCCVNENGTFLVCTCQANPTT